MILVPGSIGPFAALEVEAGGVEEADPALDMLDMPDVDSLVVLEVVVPEVIAPAPPVVVAEEPDIVEVVVTKPKEVVVREQDRTRSFASTDISELIEASRQIKTDRYHFHPCHAWSDKQHTRGYS